MKRLWGVMIQCDREIETRKPGIAVMKKKERGGIIIVISMLMTLEILKRKKNTKVRKDKVNRKWSI